VNAARPGGDRPTPLRWEKRVTALPRAQIDDVLLAARHLPPRDRALIDSVYRRGMSINAIASMTRIRPHGLRRRLRGIMRRLRSPLFRHVLREVMTAGQREASTMQPKHAGDATGLNPAGASRELSPEHRRAIARAIVLDRRKQRDVARDLNLTLHQVRRELDRLRAIAEQQ
jgi:DNA-directed RNA polymerase specialized sigma24 family protein